MKHTPGPWKQFPILSGSENDKGFRVTAPHFKGGGSTWIADVSPVIKNRRGDASDEGKANARLIEAAPDMYDALVAIREWLLDSGPVKDDGITHPAFVRANNAANAAIAKVDGQ